MFRGSVAFRYANGGGGAGQPGAVRAEAQLEDVIDMLLQNMQRLAGAGIPKTNG